MKKQIEELFENLKVYAWKSRRREKKKAIDFQPKFWPSHVPYGNEEVVERIWNAALVISVWLLSDAAHVALTMRPPLRTMYISIIF